jgi:hypothetical protein
LRQTGSGSTFLGRNGLFRVRGRACGPGRLALGTLLLWSLGGCGSQNDPDAEKGTTTVRAQGSIGLGIAPIYTVGPETPAPLSGQDRFALGADGSLVVFDLTASRIHRWGPTGEYVGSFGRAGKGPGEIQGGDDLVLGPRGEVVAAQFLNFRLSAWAEDGSSLWDRALEGSTPRLAVRADTLWVKRLPQLGGNPSDPIILEALDLRTGEPLGLADTLTRAADASPEVRPTCHGCRWVAGPDGTFLSHVSDPRHGTLITQFRRDGAEIRRFGDTTQAERPYFEEELQHLSDELYERGLRIARTTGMQTAPRRRSVEALAEQANNYPRYMRQGFGGFDAFGRVWLLPSPSQPHDYVLEVYGGDGVLLGEVPLDLPGATELQVAGGVLAIRRLDEFGLPWFHVFAVENIGTEG